MHYLLATAVNKESEKAFGLTMIGGSIWQLGTGIIRKRKCNELV